MVGAYNSEAIQNWRAIVIYSCKQGTGKTLFAEWFANHIIGVRNSLVSKNMGDVLNC